MNTQNTELITSLVSLTVFVAALLLAGKYQDRIIRWRERSKGPPYLDQIIKRTVTDLLWVGIVMSAILSAIWVGLCLLPFIR